MDMVPSVDSKGYSANAATIETLTETETVTTTTTTKTEKTTTQELKKEFQAQSNGTPTTNGYKHLADKCADSAHGHHGHHEHGDAQQVLPGGCHSPKPQQSGCSSIWSWMQSLCCEPPTIVTLKCSNETPSKPSPQPTPTPTPKAEPKQPAPPQTKQIDIGNKMKFTGDFLWKPTSDKDGNLVILLPEHLTGKVASLKLVSKDRSKRVGKGRYSGIGNGNREHFRFKRPGSAFPKGSIVVIKLTDGSTIHVPVKHTNRRVQK